MHLSKLYLPLRYLLADTNADERFLSGINIHDADTLERAVESAAEIAESGDLVLLSPACASFDMFKDYAHRAQAFIDAVNELARMKGQVSA